MKNNKTHTCNYCGERFSYRQSLTKHIKKCVIVKQQKQNDLLYKQYINSVTNKVPIYSQNKKSNPTFISNLSCSVPFTSESSLSFSTKLKPLPQIKQAPLIQPQPLLQQAHIIEKQVLPEMQQQQFLLQSNFLPQINQTPLMQSQLSLQQQHFSLESQTKNLLPQISPLIIQQHPSQSQLALQSPDPSQSQLLNLSPFSLLHSGIKRKFSNVDWNNNNYQYWKELYIQLLEEKTLLEKKLS